MSDAPVSDERLRQMLQMCGPLHDQRWLDTLSALRELLARREADAWRPIESAPLKEDVLVLDEWGDVWIAHQEKPGRWLDKQDDITLSGLIHWRPLPAAPGAAT